MPRIFGWFNNSASLLSCQDKIQNMGILSLLLRKSRDSVVVVGPLSHDLSPYAFLDLSRQIRLLGLSRPWAEKYAHVLEQGGIVICIDMPESSPLDVLKPHDFRDPKMVPAPGNVKPTGMASKDQTEIENARDILPPVHTRARSAPDF